MAEEDDIPRAAGARPSLVTPAAWEAMRQAVKSAEVVPDPTQFQTYRRGKKKFFRLRPPGESVREGPAPFPPFLLAASTTGARYYKGVLEWFVTRLTFEKKYIYDADGTFLADVNGLVEQAPIDGVKTMEVEGESSAEEEESTGPPADDWRDLDWFGDVWAVVQLDPETAEPVALTIEGPDEPEMQPISKLNSDLSRESGSGSGGRIGYTVKIGTVPATGPIVQERTGNLQWFVAFVPENETSGSGSGGSSSSGSGSAPGDGWWGVVSWLFTPAGGGGSTQLISLTFEAGNLKTVALDGVSEPGTEGAPGEVEIEVNF